MQILPFLFFASQHLTSHFKGGEGNPERERRIWFREFSTPGDKFRSVYIEAVDEEEEEDFLYLKMGEGGGGGVGASFAKCLQVPPPFMGRFANKVPFRRERREREREREREG